MAEGLREAHSHVREAGQTEEHTRRQFDEEAAGPEAARSHEKEVGQRVVHSRRWTDSDSDYDSSGDDARVAAQPEACSLAACWLSTEVVYY
jgi:hypothetical protein